MDKKVIIITGASGGMGTSLSNFFLEEECKLALHYNNNPVVIPESENVAHFKADLTVESEVNDMVESVLQRFGKIDVLINNAGVSRSSVSWKMDASDWRESMAVNLDAPFFMAKHVIPSLRSQKSGRIINITSVVAQTGFIGTTAYAASKAGLIGMTKSMSKELANSNISVNALALGYFNIGMIDDVPASLQKEIISSIPLNKLGEPETVFETIKWLISDAGGYVTGQTINLNGGLYS